MSCVFVVLDVKSAEQKASDNTQDDEEDPLDAFMADMNEQAKAAPKVERV